MDFLVFDEVMNCNGGFTGTAVLEILVLLVRLICCVKYN